MRILRLGTRASQLALVQAESVAKMLSGFGVDVELVEISTEGDRSSRPVAEFGGQGVFVSALRDALLAGDIDLAVHSYKDLPTRPADGLVIAGIPRREDPRDVLCAHDGQGLLDLPTGARVGTGAPRRVAQLRRLRPDLEYAGVRGNIDTRLRKLADGEYDAIVIARAGLARLGRLDAVTATLDEVLPAPAQGALALECRAEGAGETPADAALRGLLAQLDDAPTRAAVTAERALLATLEGGCSAPVGALAVATEESEIYVRACVVALDGSEAVTRTATGPIRDADAVGRRLAGDMLDAGAAHLLGSKP
ncbi:MAG: hydroxymethylbilane synthase [Mycobacteriales bacterium]|jgi:hydroxymethylbilane synthase